MKTSIDYLDAAKAQLNINTDKDFALTIGVHQTTISQYRLNKRGMDNYTATRIADILDLDPFTIIATASIEREQNNTRKKWWINYLKKRALTQ